MPGITVVSFLQMKRNNTLFNYTAKNLAQENVHWNVEPSILPVQIIVPANDIPTPAIKNHIPANNIPTPANETVIWNPPCPMTCLIERMAEYRKAKNTSIELNSASDQCDARLDTEFTISPIDVLEQQIIVTPGSEETLRGQFQSWNLALKMLRNLTKRTLELVVGNTMKHWGIIVKFDKKPTSIAEPLLLKAVKANPGATLPGFHAVAAAGNRIRSKSRPKHPKDQFFDLDTRNLPKKFFFGKRLLLAEEKNADVISFSPPDRGAKSTFRKLSDQCLTTLSSIESFRQMLMMEQRECFWIWRFRIKYQ
ncbi:hypothetical protein DAPPUDRAFT_114325 [Daphnia pulex]|uniref:Uncharacterized protein n=1 Tax=Daphnia pulex TaxID=6669 RepID=E9HHU7_DAPPU|nr:hypothetical protein DAPPUDRAFT_114325 [Daphnia pulex]|eukprot:EFX68704.1 hypothetical protein DAPPUDRAFT_114325 [Daphnia pulex]